MARQSLLEFFAEYSRHGDDVAFVWRRGYRTERWSYGRVVDEAFRFARELEARGIGRGDAVLLWAENSPEWIVTFWGCLQRGASVVPIDRISAPEFASRVARQVNAKLLVGSEAVSAPDRALPFLAIESLSEAIAGHASSPYASPQLQRRDIAQIIFTSGTTAEPRGVAISHGNILANVEPLEVEIRKYLRYERIVHPLRFLNLLPLSHIFGQLLAVFLSPILGATTMFLNSLKPSDLVETIRRERISVLIAVPRLIESLEREIERFIESQNRSAEFRGALDAAEKEHFLRRWWRFRRIHRRLGWKFWAFISGGAALPAATETFWHRLGYAVIQGYGLTETTSLVSVNHPFRLGKGSIGKVSAGLEMKVDSGGQILVRGENVAAGYWRGGNLEPVADQDGWFHTGDLAQVDADGRLYFKGRQKNVIVTPAGMNIYPEDLESEMRNQDGVKDCVVIGLERDGNSEPCAVLVLQDAAADAGAIVAGANRSLAEFQQVRRWFVWPELDFPRTPTQKPLLKRIAEVVEAALADRRSVPAGNALEQLVARITGRTPDGLSPSAKLESELNLSSLDRVELMSALEERYQVDLGEARFSEVTTVAQLEQLLRKPPAAEAELRYPSWGQSRLVTWIRIAVYYLLVWPATYLLAAPRVMGSENLRGLHGPVLVISNHVTEIDIGWILAALPLRFRHRLATAMAGERIATMLHPPKDMSLWERLGERLSYFLVVTLFNVFPLPKESGFLRSFSFAGSLADRGWNILLFPEGITSPDGELKPFRGGIGLLATRLNLPVVPIRLHGVFDLKKADRITAWPGHVRVSIGKPVSFSPRQKPEEVAQELERRVAAL
jgi:long-chain acyl-CoA synthetase